jgi:hypothetical protein
MFRLTHVRQVKKLRHWIGVMAFISAAMAATTASRLQVFSLRNNVFSSKIRQLDWI